MTRVLGTCCLLAVLAVPSERRVDVDGHELRVHMTGEDGPTVVLEAALGNGLEVWKDVQAAAEGFSRVIAYDRAGLGQSDPGPPPRTPARIAEELHALLTAVGAEPPYVLVGHSAGGLHVRSFAAAHPDEVAALVLVDATHEGIDEHLRSLGPEAWERERQRIEELYAAWPGGILAEWEAVRDVVDAGTLPGAHELPDVPTVVLTATQTSDDAEWLVRTPEGMKIWIALHHDWTKPLSNAIHVLTDQAGHYLHTELPSLVVAAIREACRVVEHGGELNVEPLLEHGAAVAYEQGQRER